MAEVFHYGYDSDEGWRRLTGPTNLDYRAILDGFGLFDIALALGFVGHQFASLEWRVFAKPPGTREVWGVLLDEAEYSRIAYDPYRAVADYVGLEFVRAALDAPGRKPRPGAAPVAVDHPDYLPVACGLFHEVEPAQRKVSYWSLRPRTVNASQARLTWFLSRADGAVPPGRLDELFPPIRPPAPSPPAPPDPVPPAAAAPAREPDDLPRVVEAAVTARIAELTAAWETTLRQRVKELVPPPPTGLGARLGACERGVAEAGRRVADLERLLVDWSREVQTLSADLAAVRASMEAAPEATNDGLAARLDQVADAIRRLADPMQAAAQAQAGLEQRLGRLAEAGPADRQNAAAADAARVESRVAALEKRLTAAEWETNEVSERTAAHWRRGRLALAVEAALCVLLAAALVVFAVFWVWRLPRWSGSSFWSACRPKATSEASRWPRRGTPGMEFGKSVRW
jgi:hypothetical protein